MNRRLSTILLIAFSVAAAASYLVYRVVGRQMHAPQAPATTRIVVAAHDLELGSVIKDADLSTAEWVGALPKAALVKKESIIGRGVLAAASMPAHVSQT